MPVLRTWRAAKGLALWLPLMAVSWWLAWALRYEFSLPTSALQACGALLPWVLGTKLLIAFCLREHHEWMRYVSFRDLVLLLITTSIGSTACFVGDRYVWPVAVESKHIPWSIFLFDFIATLLVTGGVHSLWRFQREHLRPWLGLLARHSQYRPALLVGANRTGAVLANQIQFHPDLKYRIVGFLDDDDRLTGTRLVGAPVWGALKDVATAARRTGAKDLFVLDGSIPGPALRSLFDSCEQESIRIRVLSNVYDLLPGNSAHRLTIRDLNIVDLLRRTPVQLDDETITSLIETRTVLVTGAGGSIGSELCRQLIRFRPRAILLVERCENNLFNVDRDLRSLNTEVEIRPYLADVCDERRLRSIFAESRPAIVFHAAAHKHVPLMELNPFEALANNVFGTKQVADLAHEFAAESFVMISTDKAVQPKSVMGLSKSIAERYVRARSQGSSTRFLAVRFGNVLGSAGSVVQIFQEQIRRGGPITLTHPDVRRYFMTIPEAAQLVLQAHAMGAGGEIFVLDMGQPIKIKQLARDMIRLSGLAEEDIDIVTTGMRAAEKLDEQLYSEDEATLETSHPKVRKACAAPPPLESVQLELDALQLIILEENADSFREQLKELCPEFAGVGANKLSLHPTNRPSKVPFARPDIRESDIVEVTKCLRSGWLTSGPAVRRFEEAFADAVGAKYAVAVNSCTAALHLAVESLGLRRGQAVLVPTMTFAATAEVLAFQGATPILVDCNCDTLTIDLEDAARKLSLLRAGRLPGIASCTEVVGLIVMHYGGHMVDMGLVNNFARKANLWVVEDSAHAFPAASRPDANAPWRRCGEGTSSVSCYSFYANKTITTGEGGMAVTDDIELARQIRRMSLHGLSQCAWDRYSGGDWDYRILSPGFKYNMTDIAAGLGIQQLSRASIMRERREDLANYYFEKLSGCPEIELPRTDTNRIHSWHLFPIRLHLDRLTIDRNDFIRYLAQQGVGASVHWRPLHLHPYYHELGAWASHLFPVATAQWLRLISLPIFSSITRKEQMVVIDAVRRICQRYSQSESIPEASKQLS